ncbi:TetR/AcrR family transcriptional regulator [Rothia nasimurium]|uniref:TetR/AcrR family transcriptional regulator n=1 Tax=Rothia nasimurium TaxID=85336 RepID=UPI001F245A3E|nr:TetR/AcrR family transcriptional regulator [Rothia nasimurium]
MLKNIPPPDRRRARSTASKQKIAAAAEHIVLTSGRAGLTASALAEQAGVSERTVFNHFKKLEDALTYQLSTHLEPCIDEPPLPQNLPAEELPLALVQHFHDAIDNRRSQQSIIRFMTLAAALGHDEFELVAREVRLTLDDIGNAFFNEVNRLYPMLSVNQVLALGLLVHNLMTAYMIGWVRFAQDVDDSIFKGFSVPFTIKPHMFVPYIHAYLDQVAAGTPVFTADGSVAADQTT